MEEEWNEIDTKRYPLTPTLKISPSFVRLGSSVTFTCMWNQRASDWLKWVFFYKKDNLATSVIYVHHRRDRLEGFKLYNIGDEYRDRTFWIDTTYHRMSIITMVNVTYDDESTYFCKIYVEDEFQGKAKRGTATVSEAVFLYSKWRLYHVHQADKTCIIGYSVLSSYVYFDVKGYFKYSMFTHSTHCFLI